MGSGGVNVPLRNISLAYPVHRWIALYCQSGSAIFEQLGNRVSPRNSVSSGKVRL
jgi:hypothetical protein